ncbi:hypothetical protein C1H46_034289 [Malus baccata]|uniref:Uncharacterized protein n=1 Tax=Malus baccata TaxID=106549 RepID=A0A540L102_MALBA|nr:hypothetical protein C1H46_034289 [Malus baccata]
MDIIFPSNQTDQEEEKQKRFYLFLRWLSSGEKIGACPNRFERGERKWEKKGKEGGTINKMRSVYKRRDI